MNTFPFISRVALPRIVACALMAAAGMAPPAARAADAASACRYVPMATLPLREGRGLQVDGSINGEPVAMTLDTGAHTTYLTENVTERLGIPLDQSGRYSLGVSGASVVYAARLKDFSIGSVHSSTNKLVLPVLGEKHGYDVLLGADYLLRMDLEISVREHKVRFFSASGCKDTYLAYWDQNAMELPFTQVSQDDMRPHVDVMLNGVKLDAIIDTGASFSVLTLDAARRAGVHIDTGTAKPSALAVGGGAKPVKVWTGLFNTFTIADETIKQAYIHVIDTPGTGAHSDHDMLLGEDFLRAHRILLATSQNRVYLSYNGGALFADPAGAAK
ncbi:MAG: aspartyl protease family protein [Pseudomonadota bacterium]